MTTNNPSRTKQTGLNTQLGLSYFVAKNIIISAEWKHNSADLTYPTHGTTEGFKSDYKANHIAVGLTYAFNWSAPWSNEFTKRSIRERLGMKPVDYLAWRMNSLLTPPLFSA